ncbi:MAG TPA: RNA methyltransferase [Ilumatobacteraceae bacterium]|nr:RNA methyltransferase [Ilumatobacteraceae bacterium]
MLTYSNPKVQRLRRLLGRRSSRYEEGAFVVEGLGLLTQALGAGWTIEGCYVAPDQSVDLDVPMHHLAPNVLERVASTESPQPVIAVVAMRPREVPSAATFVLVADRLADPGNAGTIIRSAEAAGADAVVLTPGSVDPYNPKVVRASAGSLFRVPVVEADLGTLSGFRRLGTSSHRGDLYTDPVYHGRVAVVVGNEAHGLDEDAAVDQWITIPHAGPAESLNVAMAATVLAFEVARQRSSV